MNGKPYFSKLFTTPVALYMDQYESKSVFEPLWHSGGNFLETFLPATLGISLLFHKTILVTVAGSGTSTGLN